MSKMDRFFLGPWPLVILAAMAFLVILSPSCSVEATFRGDPATASSGSQTKGDEQ